MRVDQLDAIPAGAAEYLRGRGVETLYPPQEMAVAAGLLEGRSVMVSAPTASGKTLVAVLAMLAMLRRGGRRAAYLSPLRALASEKHREFSGYAGIPMDVRLRPSVSAGDLNSPGRLYGNVLCMTNERMDLALRKREKWLEEIDLVVVDEIHLIGDPHRGPTLEMVLARLRRPGLQIVALSATITNDGELAEWLDCGLVRSDWRPVPLREGVCSYGEITMQDGSQSGVEVTSRKAPADLAVQCVRDGGQALIFVNTRRGAPRQAELASGGVKPLLAADEARRLGDVSRAMLRGEAGGLVRSLAKLVERGVAFHHAGLDADSRRTVEEHFRAGLIKVLAATPTLAAGVNLPARRVVISDITRYDGRAGRNVPISVLEYKQLCGRAGRPQYDDAGEAIVVADSNKYEILARYVHGEPEPVESSIGAPGSMPMHVLSVVAHQPRISARGVHDFFGLTLGGRRGDLGGETDRALDDLADMEMVRVLGDGGYAATPLGALVSRLYIAPKTARNFLAAIREAAPRDHTLGFLHEVVECAEFVPSLWLRQRDLDNADSMLHSGRSQLIRPVELDEVSRSLVGLDAWVREVPEGDIHDEYGVEPGDLHRMVENGRWLLWCMSRLARHEGRTDVHEQLETLRMRVAHGVRGDLAPLVAIRNVGRVRGRALHAAGARAPGDVARMDGARLAAVCRVGPRTAAVILREAAKL